MMTRVRCPRAACRQRFELPESRLGLNVLCPGCGAPMTARPREIETRLAAQEARTEARGGAAVARLPLAVLVDNVRSLWNVGSIFRTADACGVREMLLAGITGCPPRPQIDKTALGADRAVAWTYRADPLDALGDLTSRGFEPVAVENSPGAVAHDELEWPERPCLIVGNEVAGVSPQVLERCSIRVAIPMLGVKDSLNVAVAFGIVAHSVSRVLVGRGAKRRAPSVSA